jgi:hypothetical protein
MNSRKNKKNIRSSSSNNNSNCNKYCNCKMVVYFFIFLLIIFYYLPSTRSDVEIITGSNIITYDTYKDSNQSMFSSFDVANLSSNFTLDDPYTCIISKNSCNTNRTCSSSFYDRSCLLSEIPPWTASNDKITCCFKCCYEYFIAAYKLGGDKILDRVANIHGYPVNISTISYRNMIHGVYNTASISSQILTKYNRLGNISVMHVTTVTDSSDKTWFKILGRRVVLISPTVNCVGITSVVAAMMSWAPMNNPRISSWHTSQLPCKWKYYNTLKGQQSVEVANIVTPIQSRRGITIEHKERKKDNAHYLMENIPALAAKMHMIALGVRDSKLFTLASQDNNNLSLDTVRSILIDCSCAIESGSYGIDLAKQLRKQGLNCRNNIDYSIENKHIDHISKLFENPEQYFSSVNASSYLYEYYLSLKNVRFVLSPSNDAILSHCEWEAISAGAIPLIEKSVLNDPLVNDLYSNVPILEIDNWKNVDVSFLKKSYEKIENNYKTSNNTSINNINNASISKAYFPYWLYQVTNDLIVGKAPSRFFLDIKSTLQKNIPRCNNCNLFSILN